MSDDKQHPADYALKRAQDWAVSAEEGGSYEATHAAALTSLAWSAVSFLSRDMDYQALIADRWAEMLRNRALDERTLEEREA